MSYSGPEWKDKTVLVSGATGMLGRSVVRLLLDANADVTALVRNASTCPRSCKALVCDVTDFAAVSDQLQSTDFDFILHLAAQSQVDGFEARTTFESNISGTLNLLEAVRVSNQNATMIVASTEDVSHSWAGHAAPGGENIDVGPYPASKMCAEVLAHCYASSFGLSVGIARLTNLYGPYDRNMRRLVPGTICSVLKDQAPSFRSDPETQLNFLYVDDAAAAILYFAEQLANGLTALRTVTVCNRTAITLGEMVDAILTCMERPDLRRGRPPGAESSGGNPVPTEFGKDWGWRPQVSLEDGLDATIRWYEQNFTG